MNDDQQRHLLLADGGNNLWALSLQRNRKHGCCQHGKMKMKNEVFWCVRRTTKQHSHTNKVDKYKHRHHVTSIFKLIIAEEGFGIFFYSALLTLFN